MWLTCWLVVVVVLGAGPAAAQSAPTLTRIAFGSCAHQERPQPIWEAILQYRPELFLFLGDNVYGDVRDGTPVANEAEILDSLRLAYSRAAAIPGLTRLRQTVPHLATWDDHDYGRNDGGAEFVHKRASQQLFADFWQLPAADPRWQRDGVYHAQVFGPPGRRVQVILLDTRFFRSALTPTDQRGAPGKERYVPDPDPMKTMLGAPQWTWLAAQLTVPAELRLLVSSVQVVADGHGWERWGNLPLQRQQLYDLIRTTGADRVVVLSGDRHVGAIYRETQGVPFPLIEITASGITQAFPGAVETSPQRVGALYGAVNFGTIEIDWWAERLTVHVRGENGEPVRTLVVSFQEISRPQ
jgi:alkaline phosphatase D